MNKIIRKEEEWSISVFGQVQDVYLLWNQYLQIMVRTIYISLEVINIEVAIENMIVDMFAQKLYQM